MLKSSTGGRPLYIAFALVFAVGAGAAALVGLGNPGNMGICGACFLRDSAGSLGLFAKGPRIFRPELTGLVLGALAFCLLRRRFEARSGSHAATRLFFGIWMAIGSLVFLGCPFRMLQRMGGGDLNAWVGLIGLIGGVGAGLFFERRGYNIGKTQVVAPAVGLLGPLCFVGLLLLYLMSGRLIGPGPGEEGAPAHAPWMASLLVAAGAGAVLAATRFCAITSARQIFQRQRSMLLAAGILIAGYALISLIQGRFNLSFEGQPAAHSEGLWNVLALALVGLCGCLTGGCPVRQVVMTGEGNGDAFVTVLGLIIGGALAHTLGLASSGAGTSEGGRTAIMIGIPLALGYAAWISAHSPRASAG